MFESIQDGVTSEQRRLLNASCEGFWRNGKFLNSEDSWWIDETTGLVDVGGNFIWRWGRAEGLLGIKFGKIRGYFKVEGAGLEDASDLPREIGSILIANSNRFRTLEGIGLVKGSITMDGNLLVSLEGMTKNLLNGYSPSAKFHGLAGNPVRSGFLREDIEEVLSGETTWTQVYLEIAAGEYKVSDDSIEWILENKLGPEVLGPEIKKNPEKMAMELGKISGKYREKVDKILSQIDFPPGFREDKDLIADLGDIGL